jgi:hypothetical protein
MFQVRGSNLVVSRASHPRVLQKLVRRAGTVTSLHWPDTLLIVATLRNSSINRVPKDRKAAGFLTRYAGKSNSNDYQYIIAQVITTARLISVLWRRLEDGAVVRPARRITYTIFVRQLNRFWSKALNYLVSLICTSRISGLWSEPGPSPSETLEQITSGERKAWSIRIGGRGSVPFGQLVA